MYKITPVAISEDNKIEIFSGGHQSPLGEWGTIAPITEPYTFKHSWAEPQTP